jgi:hypothetical protein
LDSHAAIGYLRVTEILAVGKGEISKGRGQIQSARGAGGEYRPAMCKRAIEDSLKSEVIIGAL